MEAVLTDFILDGKAVTAHADETIWDVANRQGTEIPHLCHSPEPGYRPDGNCRACMVEIEGERVLAASCVRKPEKGMTVKTASRRARNARKMVIELLLADQPEREVAHDRSSHLWKTAETIGLKNSRFPGIESRRVPELDGTHSAMRVNLDACIHCGLCVRACREVQVNDTIGMAGRGHDSRVVFDFGDPMGQSSCVACGECVQACPTGALMPASVIETDERGDSADVDREVLSVCPFCGVGCQISIKVKDDRIRQVDGANGPANENRLCVKGRFGYDFIYHPHRLVKPLIRRADAPPKSLNVDPGNPHEFFREASWEEALDVVAKGLGRLRDAHGGDSVAGFGSAKCSNEEAYLFQKLFRQGFGHNNIDHCTRLCHASSVAALMENIGSGAVTATFNEILNSDVAIIIGASPSENHPVAATYFKQFSKRGGKLIIADPRESNLSRHADRVLKFRPGTDVPLLNGIMNVIVAEGLYDEKFIDERTENWEAFKSHIAGFPPERMAEICEIDVEDLLATARDFATAEAGLIFWGMGVSQHVHGTDNSRCLISLALLCGHVGRPGTGLHPLRGQNNVQGASDAGLIPMYFPDYRDVANVDIRSQISSVWNTDGLSPTPGLTVTEIIDAAHSGKIKGMYILGENPAMSDPDLHHVREALARMEFLAVQEIFLTETANFADVILPSSAFAEKTGTVTNTNRQVQMGRPASNPPGDAKEDWWITNEIANRLGLDWNYKHPSDVFSEMKLTMESLSNITWERLESENSVIYPSSGPNDPGQPVMFRNKFPRKGGLARFTPAKIVPPDEVPDGQYPFVLSTGRLLEHWHTGAMTRRSVVLDAMEPEAVCSLNPRTLAELGVGAGEFVKLTTRRGSIELKARADRRVSKGMVFVPFAFVEAAANVLTNPAVDPYGKIPEFKFAAVRVEKSENSNLIA